MPSVTGCIVAEYQSDDWEVDCHDVTMGEMLGEGAFGSVHSGTLKTDRAILNVAIKVSKLFIEL